MTAGTTPAVMGAGPPPENSGFPLVGGHRLVWFSEKRPRGRFTSGPPLPGRDLYNLSNSGFSLGVRLSLAPATGANPWIRAGAIRHRYRERSELRFSFSEEASFGLEAGVGVWFPLRAGFAVGPAVVNRHRSWEDSFGNRQRIHYLRFEVATRYRLWIDLAVTPRPGTGGEPGR
jgi:hypothetical protein